MRHYLLLWVCRLLARLHLMCAIDAEIVPLYPSWGLIWNAQKRRNCGDCVQRGCRYHPRPYTDEEWHAMRAEYLAEIGRVMEGEL